MTFPNATRVDHERFCDIEGWSQVRNARGKTGTHHFTYEFALPTGEILRTRISHPVDRTDYGPGLWSHILTEQLRVTDEQFWTCIRDRIPPERRGSAAPEASLPADLVYQLVVKFKVSESEVALMTRQEAVDRLQRLWMERG